MDIKDITRESTAYRFLIKLETDVEHLCKMKAAEWESTLNCGEFILVSGLREDTLYRISHPSGLKSPKNRKGLEISF